MYRPQPPTNRSPPAPTTTRILCHKVCSIALFPTLLITSSSGRDQLATRATCTLRHSQTIQLCKHSLIPLLDTLLTSSRFRPTYRYPDFHTFAETLLRVNKASGRYHSPLSAAYFAISQCSRYAFSRSEAVCKLFLVEHDLREWRPKKDEKITSELVTIHSEAHYTHLLAHNIVGEPHPTRPRYWNYPFDSSNCHDWLLALLTAIVDLRTSLRSLILSQQLLSFKLRFQQVCVASNSRGVSNRQKTFVPRYNRYMLLWQTAGDDRYG